jgi:voltage-gated hydrogen channel 1
LDGGKSNLPLRKPPKKKLTSSSAPPFAAFSYFTSYFHTFDATVIVAGFVIDVLLHGVLEEIASLVVVLRLWRFFKIIEEFSVGAQEQMDVLELRLRALEAQNRELRHRLGEANNGSGVDGGNDGDEEARVGLE